MKLHDVVESKKNAKRALREHVKQGIPLYDSVFRYQSEAYFETFNIARDLYRKGLLEDLDWESQEMLETDIGKKVTVKGVGEVYLDCPYINENVVEEGPGMIRKIAAALGVTAALLAGGEISSARHTPLGQAMEQAAQEGDQIAKRYYRDLDHIAENDPAMLAKLSNKYLRKTNESRLNEAEYQGKDVELNKPKRGGDKAYYVYVKDGDKVKKVSFGSGMKAKLDDPKARKAFADRHNCEQKKDKTKAGYWSCRLPRYSKSLGLSGSGQWW